MTDKKIRASGATRLIVPCAVGTVFVCATCNSAEGVTAMGFVARLAAEAPFVRLAAEDVVARTEFELRGKYA